MEAVNAGANTRDEKHAKEKNGKTQHAEARVASKDVAAELSKIRGISTQATEAEPLGVRETAHESAVHEH